MYVLLCLLALLAGSHDPRKKLTARESWLAGWLLGLAR